MFQLDRILPFKDGHGHVLVVMEMKYSFDRKIIIEGIRAIGITKVEFVMKTRSIIVQNITCILEQMLSSYLEGTNKTLLEHSHTQYVDSSLLEVNAILKRLKQAKCYPEPLTEIVEPENNEIGNILLRFVTLMQYSTQFCTMYHRKFYTIYEFIEILKTILKKHPSHKCLEMLIDILMECHKIVHLWIANTN